MQSLSLPQLALQDVSLAQDRSPGQGSGLPVAQSPLPSHALVVTVLPEQVEPHITVAFG